MDEVETGVEAGEGAPVDPLVAVLVLGWPEAAVETRFRAAVIVDCKESFRLDVASHDDMVAAPDEGTLPVHEENSIDPN